ncbi:hypothetical protein N7G274_009104 [Stereocaulon virgatum]|uniref:Uncharacterized protein n=1 Tax=Stereocaulon virgatum TaxID=373712 RepID=A0ABR3ZYS5_9LECA
MSSSPIARHVLIGNMAAMQANNLRTVNNAEVNGDINRKHQSNDVHSGNANSVHMEHGKAFDYELVYETVPIGYFPRIPVLIFHLVLNMYSEPALTQKEYEDVVMAKRQAESLGTAINELVSWNHADEIIAVTCSNEPTSISYRFEIMRSALERSPVLAEFFKSFDYLYSCGMMLTFPDDLAVCFYAVKEYLEKGPDIYDEAALKSYATVGNVGPGGVVVETFTFLVRLHKLATKLELRGLQEMTLVVLNQIELSMTPQSCIALAGLVFKDEPFGFQDVIKTFVLQHVGNYFEDLHRSRDWNHVLATTSNDFQVKWARLVIAHYESPIFYRINNNVEGLLGQFTNTNARLAQLREADEAEVARKIHLNEIISLSNGERSARSSIDTTATAIHDAIDEASDGEDPTTPKASETNGESFNSLNEQRTSLSTDYPRPFWQVDEKARRLLGMNNDGGGVIAGRVRPSGLSKARKSINNFMRGS